MMQVFSRQLSTWLPVLGALLLLPAYSLNAPLTVLGQLLLLGWAVSRISRREAELDRTTAATWLLLVVALLIGLLSLSLWLFKDLPL